YGFDHVGDALGGVSDGEHARLLKPELLDMPSGLEAFIVSLELAANAAMVSSGTRNGDRAAINLQQEIARGPVRKEQPEQPVSHDAPAVPPSLLNAHCLPAQGFAGRTCRLGGAGDDLLFADKRDVPSRAAHHLEAHHKARDLERVRQEDRAG